jgi:hypothetical protein
MVFAKTLSGVAHATPEVQPYEVIINISTGYVLHCT